jgi:hypothetical protein
VSDYATEETVAASDEAETPPAPQPAEADAGETGTDDWDD